MKSIEEMVNEMEPKSTVVITGGAGSLGKAFCRMLHKTHNIIVVDNSEWAIAELQKELPDVECYLMDFADWSFSDIPCNYILHLAAYKHVNLGEVSHWAFLENNVVKTEILFREAANAGVDVCFVSTDKAVEPISFYGYTKAIGEDLAEGHGFAVARLGNILSSNGSVIPTWEECIAKKKPIPITDERMTRWVIDDYDAVAQIWDMFMSGKRLIIPKCKKMRILDLLTEVLKRHGYDAYTDLTTGNEAYPAGIEIVGLRPGEKLEEKLQWE
jgi:UDP-N-acetylglucosamine 4,6-dehydratase